MCVCLSVCTRFNIYVVYLRSKLKQGTSRYQMTFRRFLIRGFRQKCFVQKLWRKNDFFAALAWSALRRVRVQSDLLDGTAFQASTLVACTEGPPHKEKYTYFALCFYFLGKLTRPRLVGHVRTPPFSDRRPPTTPTAVM